MRKKQNNGDTTIKYIPSKLVSIEHFDIGEGIETIWMHLDGGISLWFNYKNKDYRSEKSRKFWSSLYLSGCKSNEEITLDPGVYPNEKPYAGSTLWNKYTTIYINSHKYISFETVSGVMLTDFITALIHLKDHDLGIIYSTDSNELKYYYELLEQLKTFEKTEEPDYVLLKGKMNKGGYF